MSEDEDASACEFVLSADSTCDAKGHLRKINWPNGPQQVILCEDHFLQAESICRDIYARRRVSNRAAKKRRLAGGAS